MFVYLCAVPVSVSMCVATSTMSRMSEKETSLPLRDTEAAPVTQKRSLSAEACLLDLKDAVRTLVTRERACVSAAKHLRLDVAVVGGQIVCDMQGGFGRVVCQNEPGQNFGLLDDTYALTLGGTDVLRASLVSANKHTVAFKSADSGSEWRVQVQQGMYHELLLDLRDGQRVQFDFQSACCDETTDANVQFHWMAPIANYVQAVSLAAAKLADASAVFATDAYDAYDGDKGTDVNMQAVTISGSQLQDELSRLDRKLSRVLQTAQKVNERYLVSGNDGWYDLFAPNGGVLKDKSIMRVTLDDAFIQNDLLQLQENVDLVLRDVRHLGKRELEYEHGDIASIVQNLGLYGNRELHLTALEKLLNMRRQLLDKLSGSMHVLPQGYQRLNLQNVVNRRAHFISLACVDAGLRAQVRLLCGMPTHNCLLDVSMGPYQMRQIMANDAYNDIKLDTAVAETCLNQVETVRNVIEKNLQHVQNLQQALAERADRPQENVLVGAMRVQKILHALAKHDDVPIATNFNHYYRADVEQNAKHAMHVQHFKQMDNEMRKNALHTQCTPSEAQTMLLGMLDADLRNRIISPLAHKHAQQAICTVQQGRSCVHIDSVVSIFDDDIQPLVKLALGMQDSACADNVFGFLHKSKLRTGYNDLNKTRMLIDLMFTNDDA